MQWSILIAAIWVLAATATAFLPMRRQYAPGIALLVAAPVLLVWLWVDFGPLVGLLCIAGFVSMFRNPLRYFYRRARGERPEVPE